ncbi:hypothetical protein [Streptomyces sp. DH12]|uniref:hypothetical protein n=1 Tax=Streptomyces sp. DH12 TaxID=2857010 RepID=UPI001E59D44C|nr:hypothetical protein [Streptomyces sp. DH12]
MSFEDQLGEALRRTGDTFTTDRQEQLMTTAATEGRRSLRRRRAGLAVAASVVALATLGTGAYATGMLDDDRDASVAEETAELSGDRVFDILRRLTPGGTISRQQVLPREPGEYAHVSFVYDDGKGAGLVELRLGVADPRRGDKALPFDRASHEKPWTTPVTKNQRTRHVTPEGHFVDFTLWNTPDPQRPTGTRNAPVLHPALYRLLHANEWREEMGRLPKPDPLLGEKAMDPRFVKPRDTVSARGMTETLRALLPKGGTFGQERARGTADHRGPTATLVYDDGKGGTAVTVSLYRVDPDGYSTRQFTRCHVSHCVREKLPDGSVTRSHDVRTQRPQQVLERSVTYVSATGDMVEVDTRSAPGTGQAPRAVPALTSEQLKALAMSPRWRPALDALPPAPDEERDGPGRVWESGRGAADWSYLMAKGSQVVDTDGLGPGLVELRIDRKRRNTTDEVVLDVREEKVAEGGEGVTRWTVTGAQPRGHYVTVTAYNAPAPDADATRTTPAINLPEMKALATHQDWNNDRFVDSLRRPRP